MKTKDIKNEKMTFSIEFADNGIIIRGADHPDDVRLVLTGPGTRKKDDYGYDINHDEEHKAIGRIIYQWLMDAVVPEAAAFDFLMTGAKLDIEATIEGRHM